MFDFFRTFNLNKISFLGVGFQVWYAFFGDQRLINVLLNDLLVFSLCPATILGTLSLVQILIYLRSGEILSYVKKAHDQTSFSIANLDNKLEFLLNNQKPNHDVKNEIESSDDSISDPDIKKSRDENEKTKDDSESDSVCW